MAVRFLRHALYVSQCEFTLSCSHFLRWQKKKVSFPQSHGQVGTKVAVCVCVFVWCDGECRFVCVCVSRGDPNEPMLKACLSKKVNHLHILASTHTHTLTIKTKEEKNAHMNNLLIKVSLVHSTPTTHTHAQKTKQEGSKESWSIQFRLGPPTTVSL